MELVAAEPLPACVYRTVFGNCMAFPGIRCRTVLGTGKCVKERDGVTRA